MHTQTKYHTKQPVFDRAESLGSIVCRLLGDRDLEILRLVFEQRAIRFDQLARLTGLSRSATARAVERLARIQLVERAQLELGRPTWTWATAQGTAVVVPQSVIGRFSIGRPTPRVLPHLAAANEVRLHYAQQHPEATWISERMLFVLGERPGLHRPDAVVEIDDERQAIEVELTRKSVPRVAAAIRCLLKDYDAVHYLVSPPAASLVRSAKAANGWANLVIRDLSEVK